ncbi:MAG: CBS domain-containing protein [Flavobacteriales bacterium]|nr:CBS domain-containing protein [Flavobacteriales bacterium]MCB9204478.1 CBS domain-containing protein [Flavobacteriales bacterium]
MLARELISKVVPPLRPTDEVDRALAWMDEFKVSHLPVVDGHEFLGLISEDNILDGEKDAKVIASKEAFNPASVQESQHIYYVIRKLAASDLSVIAVVDSNNQYMGCITLSDLVTKFEELAVINQPGGIIVLNLNKNDYSLAQVAHVVESNNARILSSYIFERPATGKLELTLKVNREEVASIVQSLERYDYEVIAYFQESAHLEDLKGRYDELMRYINI